MTTTDILRTAVLSEDGLFRYRLRRDWNDGISVLFVMLNPSTADAEVDDPTIRRCIGFARSWGFDGLEVVNLFAWRATKPSELLKMPVSKIGEENDRHIADAALAAESVVVAWGAINKSIAWRARDVLTLLDSVRPGPLLCLGLTDTGKRQPRHPLFVSAEMAAISLDQAPR